MLKDIITILRDTFLRYKEVRTFKYQDDTLYNTQPNDKAYQVFVDDQSYHRLNITTGIFVAEFNITILKTPIEESILDVQDYAYAMACNVVEKIDYTSEYMGVIRLHDFSIVTLSHVTDNDSAGVRLTLEIETPNPANLCDDSHWNNEPYEEPAEQPITIEEKTIGDIRVNPVRLPKNPIRC